MAEVYQNAALTISADGAANDSEGLFEPSTKRSVEVSRIQSNHLADSSPVYVRKTALRGIPFDDYVHVITHKSDQPLRRRGWTLQEWLLSARVVHFTTDEILWECNDLQLCECQLTAQSPAKWGDQDRVTVAKASYYRTGDEARNRGYFRWPHVVEEFSRRQLTKQTDRLPALSGVAAFSKANAKVDYIAGLWKSELPDALLWRAVGATKNAGNLFFDHILEEKLGAALGRETTRHEKYYAPSWSWASVDGPIHFPKPDLELPEEIYRSVPIKIIKCKVLEVSSTLATSNPFGPLENSFIKISGGVGVLTKDKMRMGDWAYMGEPEGDDLRYQIDLAVDVDALISEVKSADGIPFIVIRRMIFNVDETYGIALKTVDEASSTFMRVGLVLILVRGGSKYDDGSRALWIQDKFGISERTITII
jgi:hypothetical protein